MSSICLVEATGSERLWDIDKKWHEMKPSPLSDVCSGHERHRSLVMDAVRWPFVTAQHYLEQRRQNKLQDARRWQMHRPSAPPASACENTKTLLPVFQWRWLLTDILYHTSGFLADLLSHVEIFVAVFLTSINWNPYECVLFLGFAASSAQKCLRDIAKTILQPFILCAQCVAQKTHLNMEATFL